MTDENFLHTVLRAFAGLQEITYRKMMGEYLLYYRKKLFGGLYDDRLLVKNVPAVNEYPGEKHPESPYPGAKPMIRLCVEDEPARLCDLIRKIYDQSEEIK